MEEAYASLKQNNEVCFRVLTLVSDIGRLKRLLSTASTHRKLRFGASVFLSLVGMKSDAAPVQAKEKEKDKEAAEEEEEQAVTSVTIHALFSALVCFILSFIFF